jgi:hypothetical protein
VTLGLSIGLALGEEHKGSWVPSLEFFLNGDVAPLGVNSGKQILASSCHLTLNYRLFACETNILGFVIDLLLYKSLE